MSGLHRVAPKNQVWSWKELVTKTPRGKVKKMTAVKTPRKPQPTHVTASDDTPTSTKASKVVNGWDNPWQDESCSPLQLFDPVPLKLLEDAIKADSKVELF